MSSSQTAPSMCSWSDATRTPTTQPGFSNAPHSSRLSICATRAVEPRGSGTITGRTRPTCFVRSQRAKSSSKHGGHAQNMRPVRSGPSSCAPLSRRRTGPRTGAGRTSASPWPRTRMQLPAPSSGSSILIHWSTMSCGIKQLSHAAASMTPTSQPTATLRAAGAAGRCTAPPPNSSRAADGRRLTNASPTRSTSPRTRRSSRCALRLHVQAAMATTATSSPAKT